jgi:hypothetical protein
MATPSNPNGYLEKTHRKLGTCNKNMKTVYTALILKFSQQY